MGALDRGRLITYCGGGIAASSDAFVLTLLGVTNIAVYDGSLLEWAADPSLPMETAGGSHGKLSSQPAILRAPAQFSSGGVTS